MIWIHCTRSRIGTLRMYQEVESEEKMMLIDLKVLIYHFQFVQFINFAFMAGPSEFLRKG